ncbi:alpha/beta fold hydrolase [Aquimarina sp. 2-A2]|uniref:alpha/beta fold hydrolase n=1 Tax=Aquimarina sp. 2-A2 TaxID=3382644 RepID=UPI00387F1DFE
MTLTHKQTNINYRIQGEGKALVFLHGFLENLTMWDALIPELVVQYQCIAIDLPGHGESGNLGYVHSMEIMADVVKSVLDVLAVDQAVIVGHSMGGYAGLAFAQKYRNHLLGILLLNSTSYADSEERKFTRTRAIEIVKKNPNAYTSMAISNLFAPSNREKHQKKISLIKRQATNTSLQGILAALEGMKDRPDLSLLLKRLTLPKCIIAGKEDPVLPYDQSRTESNITKTKLITLDGGHMLHIENQKECALEISDFVRVC